MLICTFCNNAEWTMHSLCAPALLLLILSFISSLLPKALRITFQLLFGEAILLLCLIESYCLSEFESGLTPRILSLVINTDAREAGEFFSTYVQSKVFHYWNISIILILTILLPISYIFENRIEKRLEKKSAGKCIVATIITAAAVVTLTAFETPATIRFLHLMNPHSNQQESEILMFKGAQKELTTPIHRLAFSWHVMRQSEQTIAAISKSCFEAEIEDCSHTSPHIVLVIGESYNKHHSPLYGYQINTTPHQQQRHDAGELFLFKDAVTPWNITNNTMMSIFSLWDNSCNDKMDNYPLFPILFRRAGYKVRFATNQFQLRGFKRGFSNKTGHFFLSDRMLSDSLFSYRNKHTADYDMELVNILDYYENIGNDSNYTLDIIHLIGQHFEYSKRYPEKYAQFSLNDYSDRSISNVAKTTVMHYDNATLYNDVVIDSILRLYEGAEAIVIYLSDHGDEVYDDDSTHSRTFQKPTETAAKYEYEVPLWIWCSKSYRERHPTVIERIKTACSQPFMTDDLPQMLLYLAGIKCQWYREGRNVLSPAYKIKKRLIDGDSDYDEVTKRQQ